MEPAGHPRGVLLVANDRALEWLRPLLASLRHHDPDLAVLVVPFDDEHHRVSALVEGLGIDLWAPEPLLALADRIGRAVLAGAPPGSRSGHFRRLLALEAPFDQTLYLDNDIVVTGDLSDSFAAAAAGGRRWTFTDTSDGCSYATEEALAAARSRGGGRQWCSGSFFVTRQQGALLQIAQACSDVDPASSGFFADDQGFINWLVDRHPGDAAMLCDVGGHGGTWAGNETARRAASRGGAGGPPTTLLHWAGVPDPVLGMPAFRTWAGYRLRAVGAPAEAPAAVADLARSCRRGLAPRVERARTRLTHGLRPLPRMPGRARRRRRSS